MRFYGQAFLNSLLSLSKIIIFGIVGIVILLSVFVLIAVHFVSLMSVHLRGYRSHLEVLKTCSMLFSLVWYLDILHILPQISVGSADLDQTQRLTVFHCSDLHY